MNAVTEGNLAKPDQTRFNPTPYHSGITPVPDASYYPDLHMHVACFGIRALLWYLCGLDMQLFEWAMRWLAYPIQNPGARMHRALAVAGAQATGKSLFFSQIMGAVHREFAFTLDANQVRGANLSGLSFVVVDSVDPVEAHDKVFQYLKPLLTNEAMSPPGSPQRGNSVNLAVLCGSPYVVVDRSARRIVTLNATKPQDWVFERVQNELQDGGIEAFIEYLLAIDLSGFTVDSSPEQQEGDKTAGESDGFKKAVWTAIALTAPDAYEAEIAAPDSIARPAHYTSHPSGVECIQITEHMSFNLGNVVKYLWRADEKGAPIQDLEKAAWYLQREISNRKAADAKAQRQQLIANMEERIS